LNDRANRKQSEPTDADKPRIRPIGSIVNQLLSRRGYAQVSANERLQQVVADVVGPSLAGSFEVGNLRRGVLYIFAVDSVTLQELNFQKRSILHRVQQESPSNPIADVRFRIQSR